MREYTDEGETDFVREVSGTSPGGFFELDGGGFMPGNWVVVTTSVGDHEKFQVPNHSAVVDVVNDTVTGTADIAEGINIAYRSYEREFLGDESVNICSRGPDNSTGSWETDYSVAEDLEQTECTAIRDILPGDWLQIASGGNPIGDVQLAIEVPLFPDVDRTSTHAQNISQMAIEAITLGCDSAGNYCPDDGVRRDQMASFLDRASDNADLYGIFGGGGGFTDVVAGSTHAAAIDDVAAAGITVGCNPEGTLFCPADLVTREQMATFLARALGLAPIAENRFSDVVTGSTHAGNINAVVEAGITLGCDPGGTMFCPSDVVTRAQMASFIIRALNSA